MDYQLIYQILTINIEVKAKAGGQNTAPNYLQKLWVNGSV